MCFSFNKNYLLFFLFPLFIVAAKGQYQIVDKETKAPVPYAHIQLTTEAKGAIANFDGFFVLDSSLNVNDTILISCIGYKNKSILIKTISAKNSIELEPRDQQLSEVVVTVKKSKFRTRKLGLTKKPKKIRSATDYTGTAKNGQEKAVWIPNDYSIQGILKSVNIYVSKVGYPNAHFRIHIYDCDPLTIQPSKELTHSNIIASGTKGNEWVEVDMTKEQIQVGENGCFIGIEWFDSPQSKFYRDTLSIKGYTYDDSKTKDTIYSRIRSGYGAVVGAIFQKYRKSKNKLWNKKDEKWINKGIMDETVFYTTDTFSDGRTFYGTPDNYLLPVLCININVAFPKGKVDVAYRAPKKRKLNRLEKTKKDLIKYPQSTVSELFSSLIKAFENDDIVYVFKYLCVYQKGQLDDVIDEFEEDIEAHKVTLAEDERVDIIKYLKEMQAKLTPASILKIDDKHFTFTFDNERYHLTIDRGIWKINPYSYRIYKPKHLR